MNLVDAVVEEVLEGPHLVDQPDGARLWEVRYIENCYGRRQERTRKFMVKPDHFIKGFTYRT